MPKYEVGVAYSITGIVYIPVEAANEDDADDKIMADKQRVSENITEDLCSSDTEWEITDIIPGKDD